MSPERLAFSLAHSIWQAFAIAGLSAASLRFVPRRSAAMRYAVSVGSLLLMPAAAIATYFLYGAAGSLLARRVSSQLQDLAQSQLFARWTQWIVLLWLAGVVTCSVRLSIAWVLSRRMLRSVGTAVPESVLAAFQTIKATLGVSKPVRLLLSTKADAPLVIGWLRPAVLLPVAAITGLAPEYLHAVLAHELAHVRRHDFVVNLLQGLIESLMFYHPAVWWMSRRVRAERENCCDDQAVEVCGDRFIYARALVELEQARVDTPMLAVAATGGSLGSRVRRILGCETPASDWQPAAAAAVFAMMWLVFGFGQSNVMLAGPPSLGIPPAALEPPAIAAIASPELPILRMALLTLSGAAPVALQQQQQASLQGTVTRRGSSEPLPGSKVSLQKSDGTWGQSVITGSDGSYLFNDVAAGVYRLLATRSDGFLPAEYGQSGPTVRGIPITVTTGQTLRGLQLEMAPPASVSGRIYDADGQPLAFVKVQALRTYYEEGRKALTIKQSVQTNDIGEYRLFWLPPGKYYILAQREDPANQLVQAYIRPSEDPTIHAESSTPVVGKRVLESGEVQEEVFVPVYLPGTPDVQKATALSLQPGDNINGADINFVEMPASRRVRGLVIDGSTGQPMSGGAVRAIPTNSGPNVTIARAATNPNGLFEVSGLAPGSYDLFALGGGQFDMGGRVGHIVVQVGAKDVDGAAIIVPPTFDLHGRFVIDGASNLDVTRLRAYLRRYPGTEMGTPSAQQPRFGINSPDPNQPGPDGTFTLAGVGPGDYRIGVNYTDLTEAPLNGTIYRLPPDFYIKSARLGSEEVINKVLHLEKQPDGQLQIVLGTDPPRVTGNVHNESGDPVANSLVLLVPEARERVDLFRTTGTDAEGNFRFRAPEGTYKLFAFDYAESGAWFDPAFMQSYEGRGTTIQVGAEAAAANSLALIKVRNPQ